MSRHEAERNRWQKTDGALARLRRDLQLRGVSFSWRREGGRLVGQLDGHAAEGSSFAPAAFATTLLAPLFPSACIEPGSAVQPSGRWRVVVWLDAPEAEARRREHQHQHLDPAEHRAAEANCPHDGAGCRMACGSDGCWRERQGMNLRYVQLGYPQDGHPYPARGDASEAARCPHDGKVCKSYCGPACRREYEGTNAARPVKGYPLAGHVYPAPGVVDDR